MVTKFYSNDSNISTYSEGWNIGDAYKKKFQQVNRNIRNDYISASLPYWGATGAITAGGGFLGKQIGDETIRGLRNSNRKWVRQLVENRPIFGKGKLNLYTGGLALGSGMVANTIARTGLLPWYQNRLKKKLVNRVEKYKPLLPTKDEFTNIAKNMGMNKLNSLYGRTKQVVTPPYTNPMNMQG